MRQISEDVGSFWKEVNARGGLEVAWRRIVPHAVQMQLRRSKWSALGTFLNKVKTRGKKSVEG